MLIEFSVANFRSIRDDQTLSLLASKAHKELPGNVITNHDLPGISNEHFLRGAAIYGPNASGKSTLIHAIAFLRGLLNEIGDIRPGEPIPIPVFVLDEASVTAPSIFRIHFVAGDGVRYEYGIALNRTRVLEEGLTSYPKGKALKVFHREFKEETGRYAWNLSGITKGKATLDLLVDICPENTSLLSRLSLFKIDELNVVADWFRNRLCVFDLSPHGRIDDRLSVELLRSNPLIAESIKQALRIADLGISDARVTIDPITQQPKVVFLHEAADGESRPLPLESESAGTLRYFAMIGPLIKSLHDGNTVVIDEIDTSLHPMMVRAFVKLFNSPIINWLGAQLIFSTHNPILLDTDLLRRDQYWFTDKARDGATHLYPLVNYAPRKDESLLRGYVGGRYGAIPFMPEGLAPVIMRLHESYSEA